MWVVRPVGDNVVAAVVAWLRGREAIYVYGTAETAQAAADRLNKGPLATAGGGAVWTIEELPGLLVEVVDELRAQLRLVEGEVARMREAGAVAVWPSPEPESPAGLPGAEKKTTLNQPRRGAAATTPGREAARTEGEVRPCEFVKCTCSE